MKIALRKPLTWEEQTYQELDLNLDALTGADLLAVSRELRREQAKEPVLQPETDDRYLIAVAARAARVPCEALAALPARDFVRIKMEVQGFLLGAGSAEPEATAS